MAASELLGPTFSALLFVLLGMMVYTTYILARRPLIINLREIYFFHNQLFTRAWYLIIAGMTMFLVARVVLEGERTGMLEPPEGIADLFLILFATFVFMAFLSLLVIFRRYMSTAHNGSAASADLSQQVREAVLRQDDHHGLTVLMSRAEDIYRGRPTLGPQVHLSHYRGVVLSLTRYLEQRFGKLGDALLYSVGRQTGRDAARHMRDEGRGADDVVDRFLLELQTALVAVPSIAERSPTRVRLRFDECALCSGTEPAGAPQCHYLTGLCHGLFEAVTGQDVQAREIDCCSQGDRSCVVEVRLPAKLGP